MNKEKLSLLSLAISEAADPNPLGRNILFYAGRAHTTNGHVAVSVPTSIPVEGYFNFEQIAAFFAKDREAVVWTAKDRHIEVKSGKSKIKLTQHLAPPVVMTAVAPPEEVAGSLSWLADLEVFTDVNGKRALVQAAHFYGGYCLITNGSAVYIRKNTGFPDMTIPATFFKFLGKVFRKRTLLQVVNDSKVVTFVFDDGSSASVKLMVPIDINPMLKTIFDMPRNFVTWDTSILNEMDGFIKFCREADGSTANVSFDTTGVWMQTADKEYHIEAPIMVSQKYMMRPYWFNWIFNENGHVYEIRDSGFSRDNADELITIACLKWK